ncbi:hypothetical protein BIV57_10595 [Mangrovactinospora gilvigrisea]|uniref:Uncharacterized protein n=1 Tax=Mangrovactinospora gilvigrisea TaxID=1428644 RepID=A0A1J7C7J4_9ACTN|nr:hypothetical protein [Mangrovactinospora gilvigrisea]OIV37512.1 hypothetical protein BIV57_10595 [Mangrovactinospora gilvigrisea]
MRLRNRGHSPHPRLAVLDHRTEQRWTRLVPDPVPRLGPRLLAHIPPRLHPARAHRSGDRLLVLTHTVDYHAWGFLGPALLFDTAPTAPYSLVAELRGERGAALPGDRGRFVIGLEGYGTFDTWQHGPDGSIEQAWHSFGHYAPDPDGSVRVLECDRNTPTESHLVRLHQDGTVERGPALRDGQCSEPVRLPDDTLLFVDGTTLRAAAPDLGLADLVDLTGLPDPTPSSSHWRFHAELALHGDRLEAALFERSAEPPVVHTTHRWTFSVLDQPPAA